MSSSWVPWLDAISFCYTYFDDAMKFNSSYSLLLFFLLILSSALHFSVSFFSFLILNFVRHIFFFFAAYLFLPATKSNHLQGRKRENYFEIENACKELRKKIYQEIHWRNCELWMAKEKRRKTPKYAEEMRVYHPDEGKNYAKMRGRSKSIWNVITFSFSPHLRAGWHSKDLRRTKKFMFSFTIFNFNFVIN